MKTLQTDPRPAERATARPRQTDPNIKWSDVTVFDKFGGMICLSVAELNGKKGVVNSKQYRNWSANCGSEWEVCINREDYYSDCVAQSWYNSMKDAIADNGLTKVLKEIASRGYIFVVPDHVASGVQTEQWMKENNIPIL